MKGVNKAIVVGNLGQDPEVRYMPNGGAVTNLSVATSEKWKDKNTGEEKTETEWHRVVIFGKAAEHCGNYLKKGSSVYIEGKIKTRKWQDQSGQDKYSTEIVVDGFGGTVQFLSSPNTQGQQQQGFKPQQQTQQQKQNFQQQQLNQSPSMNPNHQQPVSDAPFSDDIPF